MNFQELVKNKFDEVLDHDDSYTLYIQGALMAKNAIIDLLITVNDGNYNNDGEHINAECREEAETIERLIRLIKYGNDYE